MDPRSLGYQTELAFPLLDGGELVHRDDYVVARTPTNPGYWWGNFVLFRQAPRADDIDRWPAIFEREQPGLAHRAFGWDAPGGELGEAGRFVDAGFELVDDVVMTATVARPPAKQAAGIDVRPLDGPDQRLAIACDPRDGLEDAYGEFKRQSRANHRRRIRAGHGMWLGAFDGARAVGQLGLFRVGDRLVRTRDVETDPDFRRRGICSMLIAEACRRAFAELDAATLVIIANVGSHAAGIYQAAGFTVAERMMGLHRAPRSETSADGL